VEIYLDVLFLENLVVNYLILVVTSKFLKRKTSNLRLFIGALVGAAYVIPMILFPGIKFYYTVFAKFLLSLAIVAIAFSPEKPVAFVKTLAYFYVSTFIFAGAAFAFLYFNQNGGFVKNGIVYVFWQSNWTVLFFALSVITVFIIIKICWELVQQRFARDNLLVPLRIAFENKSVDVDALIDTGNSLHDPLTNMPVVVVEFRALKEILPSEISVIFDQYREDDLVGITDIISGSRWYSRFRLIPFTSLGKENGMLIGFKPDYIQIGKEEERKGIYDVIVGIYNRSLSKNERYRALLNPELV